MTKNVKLMLEIFLIYTQLVKFADYFDISDHKNMCMQLKVTYIEVNLSVFKKNYLKALIMYFHFTYVLVKCNIRIRLLL